ncbi:ATP-binding cassette domain-containing protein [Synergistes jonesii]|uniref:ATP-binding cassette domain-containing protein n=1 Tax=Synergistes jonesii TaxID=2754 RepID=UPI00242C80BA|nr:ATP-binding cassette domain-containing protein [Synergistes jonesii]
MPLSVDDISYSYNKGLPTEREALHGVSFRAESGILSVIGHTGSGKSTLAQHLNALIIPQSGSVTVDGSDTSGSPAEVRSVRKKVGLVFQYPEQQIFAESVEEEISFAPKNWGFDEEGVKKNVAEALAAVSLSAEFLPLQPYNLSGGQKRKIAIASVIAAKPSYLVLDEPTAGLDCVSARELEALLAKFAAEGMGIIHITHDVELALRISSEILILEDGRVVFCGAPEECAEFLCSAPVRGLVLPDVLELSKRLASSGVVDKLEWNAETLLERLKEKWRARTK